MKKSFALPVVLLMLGFSVENSFGFSPFDVLKKAKSKQPHGTELNRAREFTGSVKNIPGRGSLSGTVYEDTAVYDSYFYLNIFDSFGHLVHDGFESDNPWTVSNLYPGNYRIQVTRERFFLIGAYEGPTFYPNSANIQAATWVTVNADQAQTGLDITLLPDLNSNMITISGICYIGDGFDTLATGVFGNLIMVDVNDPQKKTTLYFSTGATGAYSVERQVEPGNYNILVKTDKYLDYWWGGGALHTQPPVIAVGADPLTSNLHFYNGASISGTIVDTQGNNLETSNNIVLLDQDGYNLVDDYRYVSSFTDSSYEVEGIYPGNYYLKVEYQGENFYYNGPAHPGELITVNENQVLENINFVINYTGPGVTENSSKLVGMATRKDNGQPVPETRVSAQEHIEPEPTVTSYHSNTADSLGRYSINVTPGKSYILGAEPPEYEYYLAETWYDGVTVEDDATPVTITANDSQTLNFSLEEGGSLGGFFTDNGGPADYSGFQQGDPGGFPSNVYLIFTSISGSLPGMEQGYATSPTLLSGFRFNGVKPETYNISGIPYNYGEPEVKTGYSTFSKADIIVTAGQTTTVSPTPLTRASGGITGTIQYPDSATQSLFVICYDENGDAVAMYLNLPGLFGATLPAGDTSLLHRFYTKDPDFKDPTAALLPSVFYLNFLPPGNYTLATLNTNNQPHVYWYGGVRQIITSPGSGFSFYSANIPDGVQWITVADGQIVTVNDFTVGVKPEIPGSAGPFTGIRLLKNPVKDMATIRYSLPTLPSDAGGYMLTVYSGTGQTLTTQPLSNTRGTYVWKKRKWNSGFNPSGFYLFKISGGEFSYVVKGIVY